MITFLLLAGIPLLHGFLMIKKARTENLINNDKLKKLLKKEKEEEKEIEKLKKAGKKVPPKKQIKGEKMDNENDCMTESDVQDEYQDYNEYKKAVDKQNFRDSFLY